MKQIRFDDIAGLEAHVSEDFGPWSAPVQVTQEMIQRFADLTGDHAWIHVDVERARRESPFGGPIAHGLLTLSLFPELPGDGTFEVVGHGNSTNYGLDHVRYLAPVPSGAEVRARARLAEVRRKKRGTLLVREVEVRADASERAALVCRPLTLYMPRVEPRGA